MRRWWWLDAPGPTSSQQISATCPLLQTRATDLQQLVGLVPLVKSWSDVRRHDLTLPCRIRCSQHRTLPTCDRTRRSVQPPRVRSLLETIQSHPNATRRVSSCMTGRRLVFDQLYACAPTLAPPTLAYITCDQMRLLCSVWSLDRDYGQQLPLTECVGPSVSSVQSIPVTSFHLRFFAELIHINSNFSSFANVPTPQSVQQLMLVC
jgi:hypothetical protein